jgi:hypothetical protein
VRPAARPAVNLSEPSWISSAAPVKTVKKYFDLLNGVLFVKYTSVFNLSLLKLQHTKYQKKSVCFYMRQSGGGC